MHGPTSYRCGVGIVLLNRRGLVFAGHRRDGRQPPWQMPQGGLEPGETAQDAALRELHEETGTNKARVIEAYPDWLRYDYPTGSTTPRATMFRGQQHKWFLMAFTGADDEINLRTPHPEFSDWRWLAPEDLVKLVVPFKRDVYARIFRDFAPAMESFSTSRRRSAPPAYAQAAGP